MSLIQEALKRKMEEQQRSGAPAPLAPPPVQSPTVPSAGAPSATGPAPLAAAPQDKSVGVKVFGALVVLVALLGVAGWFVYAAIQQGSHREADAEALWEIRPLVPSSDSPEAPANTPQDASGVASVKSRVDDMAEVITASRQGGSPGITPNSSAQDAHAEQATSPMPTVAPVLPAAPPEAKLSTVAAHNSTKAWPRITVNGLLANVDQAKAAAIVNNRVITINEQIDGARVVDIQPNGVTFVYDGEQRFIGMGQTIE